MGPTSASAAAASDPTAPVVVTDFERRVGHPPGLFVLFFAEMWERFSYYGMRALLVFYMTKGFLRYDDKHAYEVYGAYSSLVYMTPFIGGMIADKLLGARRSVVIGGTLMAAGHLLMTIENHTAFFFALALLICGNGFFKPNVSTMVGTLYGAHNKDKRDGGFTLFYMGINLGAALSPLLCGWLGETYGWHYGFGLATIGMLVGLAVFVAPTLLTQILIGSTAVVAAGALCFKALGKSLIVAAVNVPLAIALLAAMVMALWALRNDALPAEAGAPPTTDGFARKQAMVLGALVIAIPGAMLLVQATKIAGGVLFVFGGAAMLYIVVEAVRAQTVERHRLIVVLAMFFFSTLFWAFFEQAGTSMNNFADRNTDRVAEARTVQQADVGKTEEIVVNQEQLGYELDGKVFTLDQLDALRAVAQKEKLSEIHKKVTFVPSNVGMGIGGTEVAASEFQAANAMFILIFGLVFTFLWDFLSKRKVEPSIPMKFTLGLVQLSLGFVALWWGAHTCSSRGMVSVGWLILAYGLHTTGELCLSPVGLSMVTKLSPARMVSTIMGGWFLSTAFSEYLASVIATFTSVSGAEDSEAVKTIPAPIESVHVYGSVFGRIAVAAMISAVVLLVLVPLLKKWTHPELPMTGEDHA